MQLLFPIILSGLKTENKWFDIEQRKLITNYHVIDGASSIKIRLNDSSLYPAKYIITQDSALDIAILFIDIPASRKISTISFCPTLPEQGEKIYVVGNPLGLEQSVTDGIVSSIREMKVMARSYNSVQVYQQAIAAVPDQMPMEWFLVWHASD